MHNLHGCLAHLALHIPAGRAYLPLNGRTDQTRHRKTKVREMNLIRNYRNWRRERETINELSRLSTRELNDLGIARADIPFIARQAR